MKNLRVTKNQDQSGLILVCSPEHKTLTVEYFAKQYAVKNGIPLIAIQVKRS